MAGVETLWSKEELQNGGLPVPHLYVLDTAIMIYAMGEGNWRIPSPEDIKARNCALVSPRTNFQEIIEPWIEFCNNVIEGGEINKRLMKTGESKLDLVALGAFNYARRVLGGNFKERTEQIKAAKRAFNALLGKEEIEEGDPDKARFLVAAFENRIERELNARLLAPVTS